MSDKRNSDHFTIWGIAAVIIFVTLASAWLTQILTRQYKQHTNQTLQAHLSAAHNGIRAWIEEEQARTQAWANEPQVITLTEQLLEVPVSQQALIAHPATHKLRDTLNGVIMASNYKGFFIISPEMNSLASTRDENTGTPNLLVAQQSVFDRVWGGEPSVSAPRESDVPLKDKHGNLVENMYTIFVLAPVKNRAGEVIAALAFRVSIPDTLDPILANERFGNMGSAYVFDRQGVMFSHGGQAYRTWMSPEVADRIVVDNRVPLRDPGDLLDNPQTDPNALAQRPLTRMAQSATAGEFGIDVDGYRDFRGVTVLGAWLWDETLGFGLATEVDKDEAYALLHLTRGTLWVLAGIVITISLISAMVIPLLRRKLHRRELHHRTLIDNLPSTAYTMSPGDNGRFYFVSDQIEALTGYRVDDFFGQDPTTLKDLIHPDDFEPIQKNQLDAVKSHKPYSYEYRLICKDGSTKWVYEQGSAVYNSHKSVTSIIGIITDVTDHKTSHKHLLEYQFALDAAAIVAITDNKGTITYVNDKFCEISQYSREELLGANHRILNSGHHPKAFFKEMYKTLQTSGTWRRDICNRAKDGSLYWVDTTVVAFRDPDGKIDRYVAIRSDITERKRIKAELHQSYQTLESKSQEMEQFTYSVSHDLKSPLVTCAGLISCIEEDMQSGDFEQVKDSTKRIRRNIDKMEQCINDLLELSRIGIIPHHPIDLDMAQVAREVVENIKPRADKLGATIQIAPDIPPAYADPVRISEVLENLISNALKYGCTKDEPARITIGWKENAGRINYFVRDQGPGIPEAYHHKVFLLFQRLDTTQDGTGVGLNIVKRIIEMHGGEVWLESGTDKGTTLWFQLPQTPSAENQAPRLHIDQQAKSAG